MNKTHFVVASRCAPGWYEVLAAFTPPEGDIDYPYMHAAHADANARASTTQGAVIGAFMLRSDIHVGRQFNLSTERAEPIDHYALQIAKRELGL